MSHPDAVAHADESGSKGLVHNLKPPKDADFGLCCSIIVPTGQASAVQAVLSIPFEQFKREAAARVKKLHITDALRQSSLRTMACEVRDAIFEVIRKYDLRIVYCARRLGTLRAEHSMLREIEQIGTALGGSQKGVGSNPIDGDRVESDLMRGLVLRLDAFAEERGWTQVDPVSDRVDKAVQNDLDEAIKETQTLTNRKIVVDSVHGGQVEIQFSVHGESGLDVTHVGPLKVLDVVDEMSFAADVVANSLRSHLGEMPDGHALNAPSSVRGWPLESQVDGVQENAWEDQQPSSGA
ncbi:MAG: hypothetical protein SFZ23_10435 [Planctomycetota bacterium]|nr:hypothetical protein [Planctomycetota bacterium]